MNKSGSTNALPIRDVLQAAGATVFERGWLSANNVLIQGDGPTALVDSGYVTHAPQTLAILQHALGTAPLDALINTHLHSDHCGGNAALQAAYPHLRTHIPPGESAAVAAWDEEVLTYRATGQLCPRFHFQALLKPGHSIQMGSHQWEVHAAKGHDPHSIVLFLPDQRLLLSADALWQNGFGVVFPELEGTSAFNEVGATLDLIEQLAPETVVPGHGPVFQEVDQALKRARSRLKQFQDHPEQHLRYALKVLVKFKLLEWQRVPCSSLLQWAQTTPYLRNAFQAQGTEPAQAIEELTADLERSGALHRQDGWLSNI